MAWRFVTATRRDSRCCEHMSGTSKVKGFLWGRKESLWMLQSCLWGAKAVSKLQGTSGVEENTASTQTAGCPEGVKEAQKWRDILQRVWKCGAFGYKAKGIPENTVQWEEKQYTTQSARRNHSVGVQAGLETVDPKAQRYVQWVKTKEMGGTVAPAGPGNNPRLSKVCWSC